MDGINKFVLLGKIAPNKWIPINEVYSEFSEESFEFISMKQALQAKANLKNYLSKHNSKNKVPLTIKQIRIFT